MFVNGAAVKVCTSEVVKDVRALSGNVVVISDCDVVDAEPGSVLKVGTPLVEPDGEGDGGTSTVVVDVPAHDVVSWRGTGV